MNRHVLAAERTVRVSADEERSLIEGVLLAVGATAAEADTVANVLVEADLRGQGSHGILRLPMIVDRVRAGLIQPRATARLTWSSVALGHMDAAHGFGHVMALFAMREVVRRAADTGIAAIGVRNNNHIGALADDLEIPSNLQAIGVEESDLPAMAA